MRRDVPDFPSFLSPEGFGAQGFADDFDGYREFYAKLLESVAGGQTSVDAQAGAPVANFTDRGIQPIGLAGAPMAVNFGGGSQTTDPAFFPGIGFAAPNTDRGLSPFGQSQFDAILANDASARAGTNALLTPGFGAQPSFPGGFPAPVPTFPSSEQNAATIGGIFGSGPIGGTIGGVLTASASPSGVGGAPATSGGGGLFEDIFGAVSDTLGGGTLGKVGGLLAAGGLLLGGASLLNRSGATSATSTSTRTLPPPSLQELELLGINTSIALDQQRAFRELFNSSLGSLDFTDQLFGFQTQEQIAENQALDPNARGAIEAGRTVREQALIPQEDQLQQQLLQDFLRRGQASPEELANIQGAADSTIASGLSDLARFRDESLNQIRLNSATRGLRPTDTPIQNEFANLGIETNRQAQNFVRDIRGQQFSQNLEFPLRRGELGLRQFATASDNLARRRAFEADLANRTRDFRAGLGELGQRSSLGLATGFNTSAPLSILSQQRIAAGRDQTTSRPSTLETGIGLAGGLSELVLGRRI